jgi:hypothetical protein
MKSSAVKMSVFAIGWFLLTSILFQGCGLNPKNMVPEHIVPLQPPIGKTLRVMDVTGGEKPVPDAANPITNEMLKSALGLALDQSKYFRVVQTEGNADIELFTSIISQGPTRLGMLEYRYELVAAYKFIEKASGKVLWQDAVQSDYGSRAFGGPGKTKEAPEGSVRDNLTILLEGIATKWPKDADR